jgi:hypothetical protein
VKAGFSNISRASFNSLNSALDSERMMGGSFIRAPCQKSWINSTCNGGEKKCPWQGFMRGGEEAMTFSRVRYGSHVNR